MNCNLIYISGKLDIFDSEDKAKLFYREFSQDQKERIAKVVRRLTEWQGWTAPVDSEIDRILSDNAAAVRKWLKDKRLTTGYLMGASE